MGKIFDTLSELNLTSKATAEIFSSRTRDNPNLNVMRDSISGVIYIDDFHVENEQYISGEYRNEEVDFIHFKNYERVIDTRRRLSNYEKYFINLDICDVGCGAGDFLRDAKELAKSVSGVELQKNYVQSLNSDNISCLSNIQEYKEKFDTLFSFHVLEHFDNPIEMLKSMKNQLKKGGKMIIEVPHANDFLISTVDCKPFIDFTLWSQHLVLHTRESLRTFLLKAGFSNVLIEGVQRYPLSNHLTWLSESNPGGHKSILSTIDSSELHTSYENALRKINATDTLVAIVTV
jgi:2-polyprenyl-3-methyl-5-hydroxy-6-metoxy-1,4-benzoquinol methylase